MRAACSWSSVLSSVGYHQEGFELGGPVEGLACKIAFQFMLQ